MKMQTYKHHSPTYFRLVMLNHQPCPKHPLKYFGSFGVLKCKDSTAYCLALPEQCKIHLVFNASQVTTNDLTLYPFIHTSVPWDPWAAWSRVLDNMPLLPESILVRTIVTKFLGRWGRGMGSRYVVRYLREIFTLRVENEPMNLGRGRRTQVEGRRWWTRFMWLWLGQDW
jgi:hypothetical protein